jgi:hypothetical protein
VRNIIVGVMIKLMLRRRVLFVGEIAGEILAGSNIFGRRIFCVCLFSNVCRPLSGCTRPIYIM